MLCPIHVVRPETLARKGYSLSLSLSLSFAGTGETTGATTATSPLPGPKQVAPRAKTTGRGGAAAARALQDEACGSLAGATLHVNIAQRKKRGAFLSFRGLRWAGPA